jgi:hypothetical protein
MPISLIRTRAAVLGPHGCVGAGCELAGGAAGEGATGGTVIGAGVTAGGADMVGGAAGMAAGGRVTV